MNDIIDLTKLCTLHRLKQSILNMQTDDAFSLVLSYGYPYLVYQHPPKYRDHINKTVNVLLDEHRCVRHVW